MNNQDKLATVNFGLVFSWLWERKTRRWEFDIDGLSVAISARPLYGLVVGRLGSSIWLLCTLGCQLCWPVAVWKWWMGFIGQQNHTYIFLQMSVPCVFFLQIDTYSRVHKAITQSSTDDTFLDIFNVRTQYICCLKSLVKVVHFSLLPNCRPKSAVHSERWRLRDLDFKFLLV